MGLHQNFAPGTGFSSISYPEFELINTLLRMRHAAGLTQNQVAQRMGTKEANISRLEKGNGNPTFKTLLNYAKACNCELHFGFKTI
ncbi:transcriptional regulator [Photorhabdus akhurstii]|uniref:Transcriptional regulator n=1 Tax=Photorhabdus akhurstii TaxID=171438 RepID=A0ABX8LNU1_9GAMM|nr:helix-turn-helix transcriptional regulator [Photorhabdus akhurstii]QXF31961.1 transcriptional regulator [Photorhabdus akhurstii]